MNVFARGGGMTGLYNPVEQHYYTAALVITTGMNKYHKNIFFLLYCQVFLLFCPQLFILCIKTCCWSKMAFCRLHSLTEVIVTLSPPHFFWTYSTSWEHFSCARISAPCVFCQLTFKEDLHSPTIDLLDDFFFPFICWASACLSTSQPNTLPVWTVSCFTSYCHTLML